VTDFYKHLASSGLSPLCNKWSILEAFDAFVSNTDDMIFDGIHGIDSRVMSTSNLYVSDSTPINYDHSGENNHQVKAISTVSVSLLTPTRLGLCFSI
jgi:hypothetical protein